HDRELEVAGLRHRLLTNDTCGGLLGSAPNLLGEFRVVLVHDGHNIGAVINHYVRLVLNGGVDVTHVRLIILTLDGIDANTLFHQRSSNVILRSQRVAGAKNGIGSTGYHGENQVGGFGGDVGAGGDLHTFEWSLGLEALPNLSENRHFAGSPFD